MRQQLGYKKTFYAVGRACIWAGKFLHIPSFGIEFYLTVCLAAFGRN